MQLGLLREFRRKRKDDKEVKKTQSDTSIRVSNSAMEEIKRRYKDELKRGGYPYSDEELERLVNSIANVAFRGRGRDYLLNGSWNTAFRIWWKGSSPPDVYDLRSLLILHDGNKEIFQKWDEEFLYAKVVCKDYIVEKGWEEYADGFWVIIRRTPITDRAST